RRARSRASGALARHEGIGRNRFPILFDREHPPRWRSSAVGALWARADCAGRPDRSRFRVHQVEPVGISDALRVLDVAAEADRKKRIIAQIRPYRAFDGAADGEVALAVGSLDQLADRLARGLEGGVKVPPRAGAAEVGER